MVAQRFNGIAAGALVALTMTVAAIPLPVMAQQPVEAGTPPAQPANVPPPATTEVNEAPAGTPPAERAQAEPTPVTGSIPPQPAASETDQNQTVTVDVPTIEPANVPPPTKADVGTLQLSPADQAVADRLKALIASGFERLIEGRKEQAAVKALYEGRKFAPVFVEMGTPSDRMKAAVARIKAAGTDGLDPADYATPDLQTLGNDPNAVAEAELKLVNAMLEYARHAQGGKVTPGRISPNIDWTPSVPEPADVLTTVVSGTDVAASLDGFNPPHEGFRKLRAKLSELHVEPEVVTVQIPSGPNLRKGKKDKRVPLLRARLSVDGDANSEVYDNALFEAVKVFQRSKGMSPTGIVNQPTVDALNGLSRNRTVEAIISNMERWRWLPRDLGRNHVFVNVPDYTLKAVKDGEVVFRTRIVAGKVRTPSPSFTANIENILVNPSWHVPQSIIYGQYLPALEQDGEAMARMGMVVSTNADGSVSIRQPPGERNALGRLKFNFSNKFQVYLHDTPQKHLFKESMRAHSAGCMRVENPAMLAEVLLSIALPEEKYTAERITRMYGKNEAWLRFKKTVPVHLVYHNAYVDDAGELVVKPDVYGYDGRVQSALKGKYMVVNERSQVVTPGKPNPVRVAARKKPENDPRAPAPRQQGFFLFPFFR